MLTQEYVLKIFNNYELSFLTIHGMVVNKLNVALQVIVLHVGTNNIDHTPEQICEGILEIVHTIREKHPSVYIVLPVCMSAHNYMLV